MSSRLRYLCSLWVITALLCSTLLGGCSKATSSSPGLADLLNAHPEWPELLGGEQPSEKAANTGVEVGALAIATLVIAAVAYNCYNASLVFLPDVTGLSQEEAEETLLLNGFSIGQVYFSPSKTVPPGSVISQEPEGGQEILSFTPVVLLVSSGPEPVAVPDVTGQPQAEAETAIVEAGFLVGTITPVYSSTIPAGTIVNQDPAAGTSVVPGSQIHLFVSQGIEQVTVPDVGGMTIERAQSTIADAHLVVGTVTPRYSETVPAGIIISQNPEANTLTARDTAVNLIVSGGMQPVSVPDVVNKPQAEAEAFITGAGFLVGSTTGEWSESVQQGLVIRQDPEGGRMMPPGTAVSLVISLGREPAAIPSVLGNTREVGEATILAAGFVVGRVTPGYSETAPAGTIIGQTPGPGAMMPPGTAINLVISQGPEPVPVPDVIGETEANAQALIEAAGFVPGTVTREYSAAVPAGLVAAQTPGPGVIMPPGSVVSFVVSLGPQPIAIPDLTGLSLANAQTAIINAGFALGPVTQRYHDTVPAGLIITQTPPPGTVAVPGSVVSLVVSQGPQPVAVPGVAGQTQSDASRLIGAAGFSVGQITYGYSASVPAGTVISQDPAAGTLAIPGSAVNLLVSQGPQPISVPDVTGRSREDAQSAITGAGLSLGTVRQEYSDTISVNHVISQDPTPGTLVMPGTAVRLVIANNVIATCDYYPLEVGNRWVIEQQDGYSLEVSERISVNGYECWKMTTTEFADGSTSNSYLVYVNGWIYSYGVFTDLYRLPEVAPNAQRLYPEFITPGISFPFIYNGLTFNVTPVRGRLSDFVKNWNECPFGNVEDTVALKLGDLVVMVLGRNMGILWQYLDQRFTTSVTIVGGCGLTAQAEEAAPPAEGSTPVP